MPRSRLRALDPVLRRNLAVDMGTSAGVGLSMTLVGVLVPVVTRRAGLDAIGLAVMATAPFLANVLALFAGRIGVRSPATLVAVRTVGGIALVLMVLAPGNGAIIALVIAFWLSVALAVPYQVRLWGQIYPPAAQGRLVGVVGTARAATSAVGALVGGLLADRIGGLEVVALGGLAGIVLANLAWAYVVPPGDRGAAYDLRRSLRAVLGHPRLRRATLAQMCLGGGFIIAAPLYPFVQVDRLALSLGEVGVLGILVSGATTLASFPWGARIDRVGSLRVFQLGSLFGVAALSLYAWAPGYPALCAAAVATGICNAAVDVGTQAVISEHVGPGDRPGAMAGWSAVNGMRGLVMPFVGTTLVALGILDVSGGIALGALVTLTGALLYRSARRMPDGHC